MQTLMKDTILWQRAEALLVFISALAIYWALQDTPMLPEPFPFWAAILIFFAPDLSFAGYALGPKVGALAYNIVHVYAFGALLMAIGAVAAMPIFFEIGLLMLAHTGFDRMFGYGLKSAAGLKVTHLGMIGQKT